MISEVEQERRKGTFIPIFFLLYIYTAYRFTGDTAHLEYLFEKHSPQKKNKYYLESIKS